MESTIPDWLTKEYIAAALQHHEPRNVIKVTDIKVNMPIEQGNNYVCDIYRVKVSYLNNEKELTKSFILKVPKECEGVIKEIIASGVGEKEGKIYNELLPKLNEIFKEHGEEMITPNSYFSTKENIIILEDMNSSGYIMVDRVKQLDYAHAELAIKALAKFHAASYIVHEREPQFVEEIGKDEFFRDAPPDSGIEKLIKGTTKILAEELKNIPELERFSERLKKFSENCWNVCLNARSIKPHEFSVLTHGDCWTNNMLFKHNDQNEPEAVSLIDLQLLNYSSPAMDLLYFLYSSVRYEVVETKREDLLKIYLDELNKKLKLFGSNRLLSEDEFKEQIWERDVYITIVNITILPWIVADPALSKIVKLDDAFGDPSNNPVGAHYRSEPYKSTLPKRLVELERKGYI